MKILIDECLPVKLKRNFFDHEVLTISNELWNGKKNGELLSLAEKEFDIFLTIDQNLSYQQNIPGYDIAVIAIRAKSNVIENLEPLIPFVLEIFGSLEKGKVYKVGL